MFSDLTIYDPAEDSEGDSEAPPVVLITGASGNIGRKLRAAWGDRYEIIAIDRDGDLDDPDIITADLSEADEVWMELFDEADIVIHLAANPNEFAPWNELVQPNMDMLSNVFQASVTSGVERIIFASSNHAMGGHREEGKGPITVDLPPKPGNFYGATKLMGERLGRSLVSVYGVTFIGLRIGWVQRGDNRPETLPDDWARALWLSNDDCVNLFTRSVEADIEPGSFVVVNGLSNNNGTRWSLTEARKMLGFEPKDGA